MKKVLFLLGCIILNSTLIHSQPLPPKMPSAFNVKQIHSGHSLTDPLFLNPWPGPWVHLIANLNSQQAWQLFDVMVGKSTAPGSALKARWDTPVGFGSPDARLDIANWDLLCITERVPLLYTGGSTQQWYLDGIAEQRQYLSQFVNNAWTNGKSGAGAPTLLWSTWVHVDNSSGNFRTMLDIQGTEWEAMQDFANQNRPSGASPVYMIPGHKMMARIYDDIQLNLVPGITNINQFFSDAIHVNALGAYAMCMVHYACLFNTSPLGLSNSLIPGAPASDIPSPALAAYLQSMAWDVVTNYSARTGVYNTALSNNAFKLSASMGVQGAELYWSHDPKDKFELFKIERSRDSKVYEQIDIVSSVINRSDYEFIDKKPEAGVSYYRIRALSPTQEVTISNTCVLRSEKENDALIFPNPFISVLYVSQTVERDFTISDLYGNTIRSGTLHIGTNRIGVSDCPVGVLILKIGEVRHMLIKE